MGLEKLLVGMPKAYLAEDVARLGGGAVGAVRESTQETAIRLADAHVVQASQRATVAWHGDAATIERVRHEAPLIDNAWRESLTARGGRNVHTSGDVTTATFFDAKEAAQMIGILGGGLAGAGALAIGLHAFIHRGER